MLFGAKLEQHLWYHEDNDENKRKDEVHRCVGLLPEFVEDSKLLMINEQKMAINFGTNSMHHQAVANVPPGAELLIWTDENLPKNRTVFPFKAKDQNMKIEGLLYNDYPIASVQYHPEELSSDSYTVDLINDLIKCSKNY